MEEPRFTQTHSAFSMACGVEVNIRATADVIWRLLIDAKGFSRWNSTVSSIEGEIRRANASGCTFLALTVPSRPGCRVSWQTSA
jgi:hypothetical protein